MLRHAATTTAFLLLASAPASANAPGNPSSWLSAFPNTTVEYYDVEGDTITAINRSIRAKRESGAGGKVMPAATSWSVKTDFKREVSDKACTVRDARAEIAARAELPRLVGGAKLTAAERARWADYVSLLEQGSAAVLAFVYENLDQVKMAIDQSNCEDAQQAATAAVEALRTHADRLAADNEKRLAALSEFRPAMLTNAKLVCRDLEVTGSHLRIVRTCLPVREWERLWKSSSEYTQQVVAKFSKSPRTPF